MKLPTNFNEFFYLVGLLLGDGTSKKFVVGKPELQNVFEKICQSLGISLTYRNYENRS